MVGYPAEMIVDGIRLRDRVWLDLDLSGQSDDRAGGRSVRGGTIATARHGQDDRRRAVLRGAETLLASWEQYARGATGAALHRLPALPLRCFLMIRSAASTTTLWWSAISRPSSVPTRSRRWRPRTRPPASPGSPPGSTRATRATQSALERRGYTVDEVTRAMGMRLDEIRLPRPEIELGPADWS